jgi:hypothetical protein
MNPRSIAENQEHDMGDEPVPEWGVAEQVAQFLEQIEWLPERTESRIDFDHEQWLENLPYALYVELRAAQEGWDDWPLA